MNDDGRSGEIVDGEGLPVSGLIAVGDQHVVASLFGGYELIVRLCLDVDLVVLLEEDFESFPLPGVWFVGD